MLRRAVVIWFLLAFLAILNGVVRQQLIAPAFGDAAGHVVSTLIFCAIIFLVALISLGWIGVTSRGTALAVGVVRQCHVEAIGAQGTYVVVGYSESRDLAGVIRGGSRVGFVPRQRFTVGVGEWIFETTRVAFEYAHNVDYDEDEGGTGETAHGYFLMLTYEW